MPLVSHDRIHVNLCISKYVRPNVLDLLTPTLYSKIYVLRGLAIFQFFFIENSIGCDWTGTTDAETWECCSSESGSQCGIQEGHCSNDDDCFMHLKCGSGNCKDQNPSSDFPKSSNCCYDPIPSKTKKNQYSVILIQLRSRLGNLPT